MGIFRKSKKTNKRQATNATAKQSPWAMIIQVLIAALTALAGFITGGNLS